MSLELKNKTKKELDKMLEDEREGLRKFRFAMSGSKTRDLKAGRAHKLKIAQILTELSNRNE